MAESSRRSPPPLETLLLNAHAWSARHAQTLVGSLGRIMQQPLATLMTMAVIAVALALPSFLSVFLQNARTATANWNRAFDISVYMDKSAPASRAQMLAKQWQSRRDVAAVRIITAEEALTQFRDASGFGSALDALDDNPLPETVVVTPSLTASTPEGMEALKTALAGTPGVQTVQVDTEWVTRMHAVMDILQRVLWLTSALLGVGVVVVVGNTVRLDILNRRAEIEVMKLVGATDGFARRPFLYSGVWYGLGGGFLAIVLVGTAVGLLAKPANHLAGLYGSRFQVRGLTVGSAITVWGIAVGLGWLSSWLATTWLIRRIEPV